MASLAGKVVIVTGASSGLGKAAALRLAGAGATVVVAARRAAHSEQVVRQIEAAGGVACFIRTDVTQREDVEALVNATLARYGKLDCAVNNAGISGPVMTPLAQIQEDGWDAVLNTNLKAVFLCMKYEILAMLRQQKGAIVNVSSIYGTKASDLGHAPYCASKFGVIGLSKSAAVDYAQKGIRVNVVAPGFTHSEMVDAAFDAAPDLANAILHKHSAMRRVGNAEETAEAIAWLCSDASSFVNGTVLPVDGGDTSKLY